MLGEAGTEQFEVETLLNGERIGLQSVHDPFIRSTVKLRGFKHAWNALFGGLKIQIRLDATPGAQRTIMMLDPEAMQTETKSMLEAARLSRERSGICGGYQQEASQKEVVR
jgi:hypothetical protein